MATKVWTSNYPAELDTATEQPAVSNASDKVDASHVNSLSTAVRGLEAEVGSDLLESGSLRADVIANTADVSTKVDTTDSRLSDQRDADTLQGRTMASAAPTDGQVLTWNAGTSQWEPGSATGSTVNIPSLWAPTDTVHASDNEFDEVTLGGWSHSNTIGGACDPYSSFDAGDTKFTHSGSWAVFQPPADTTINFLYTPMSIPTNLFVWARMRCAQKYSGVDGDFTLGLGIGTSTAGVPDRVGRADLFINECDDGTIQIQASVTGGVSYDPIMNDRDWGRGQAFEYVGIHKIGTYYHFWVYTSAGQGLYVGGSNSTMSPDVIYILYSNATSSTPGNMIMGVDFVRFVESATYSPILDMDRKLSTS